MRNKRRRRFFPARPFVNRKIRPRHRRMEMHQLDVKLNSRRARRARFCRRRALLVKVAAILATLATVSGLVRWSYREAFYGDSEFRLNRLVAVSDGVLTEADLAAAARIELGMNLMEIDLKDVRRRVAELPMVVRAEVSRELPDLLEIRVAERVPVAWLSCPSQGIRPRTPSKGFLIDERGEVFRCQKLLERYLHLPVIETRDLPEPSEGTLVGAGPVRDAIRLIQESDLLFAADGLEVAEVTYRNPFSLACRYNNGMEAVFSIRELERGLQDLRWIVSHAHSAGHQIASVNVIPSKNIPVTFHSPPSLRAQPLEGLPPDGPESGPGADPRLQRQLRSILGGG